MNELSLQSQNKAQMYRKQFPHKVCRLVRQDTTPPHPHPHPHPAVTRSEDFNLYYGLDHENCNQIDDAPLYHVWLQKVPTFSKVPSF